MPINWDFFIGIWININVTSKYVFCPVSILTGGIYLFFTCHFIKLTSKIKKSIIIVLKQFE